MVNIIAESVLEKKKEIRLRTRCWILIRSSLLYTHSLPPSSHKYQSHSGLPVGSGVEGG